MKGLAYVSAFSLFAFADLAFSQDYRLYDFSKADAFQKLAVEDRNRLMIVHRDLVLLWGALDIYAYEHDGDTPDRLSNLVSRYLEQIPQDPFSNTGGAMSNYHYQKGNPGGYSWIISSIGLKEFPYRSADGKGLSRVKGIWMGPAGNVTR